MKMQEYNSLRSQAQDYDLLFFHRYGVDDLLNEAELLPTVISNNLIAAAQRRGSDHRKWWNFIHCEFLLWSREGGRQRLRSTGFSSRVPEGLESRFASERCESYRHAILHLPLSIEARSWLDSEAAADFYESCIGRGYNSAQLPFAITASGWLPWLLGAMFCTLPLHRQAVLLAKLQPTAQARFCSQFVFDLLVAAGVVPAEEHDWDPLRQAVIKRPALGLYRNPMELLTYLGGIYDWEKFTVVKAY
jgi:hypothetical protein